MCLKWSAQGKPPGTPELYGKQHSQHQLGQGTLVCTDVNPGWWEGSRARRVQMEATPQGHSWDNEHGEGATYWWPCRTCLLQFVGRLHRAQASTFSFLAAGCVQTLPTDLCAGKRPQITQSRAHHHARITTRTRTDRQPNQEYHFEGGGRKQSRKPRKITWKGSVPSFSISGWLSALPSEDFFSWFSFFLLFFILNSSNTVPRTVHGFSSWYKTQTLKSNQSTEGGGESKPSIALQLNLCLFQHRICAPKMCVGVEIVEPTTHV